MYRVYDAKQKLVGQTVRRNYTNTSIFVCNVFCVFVNISQMFSLKT